MERLPSFIGLSGVTNSTQQAGLNGGLQVWSVLPIDFGTSVYADMLDRM
jgi:hypothetical protein